MKTIKSIYTNRKLMAKLSLVLGIASIGWVPFILAFIDPYYGARGSFFGNIVIPGVGLVVGLIFGMRGLDSESRRLATVGVVICTFGLVLWVLYWSIWWVSRTF